MSIFSRFPINALSLALLSGPAVALQPLVTDDTGTQGIGGKQVEISHVDARAEVAGDQARTRTLPLVFTLGVTETLDVYAAMTPTQIEAGPLRTSGWGNTALGAKWRFFEENGTGLALKPEIRLPVDSAQESEGLGTGATSLGLTLILSQEMPFGALHVNLGSASDRYSVSDPRPQSDTLRWSIAPLWNVNAQWRLAAELGSLITTAGGQTTHTQLAQVGAIYSPNKEIDFALGALRSMDNAANQTTTTVYTLGVTWRFQ